MKYFCNDGIFDANYFGVAIISNHHKQNLEDDTAKAHSYFFCPYYDQEYYLGMFEIDGLVEESDEEPIEYLHRKVVEGDTNYIII